MTSNFGANRAFYLLLAIFALLLFLLFSLLTKFAPLTLSHVLYDCQKILTGLTVSLPHLLPTLFTTVILIVLVAGLFLLSYKIYKTRLFVGRLVKNKIATPRKVKEIASELGINNRVAVIRSNTFSSFCYGFLNPRICLSLKLVKTLNKRELKAVLIHESYHLKSRDPLKILLSQVATSMFFFVPVLKDLQSYYALSKEIAADQLAIRTKSIKDLKSAFTKSLNDLSPNISTVATFSAETNLEQRVKALTTQQFSAYTQVSVTRLIISLGIIVVALGVLNLPVHAMENGDGTHSFMILSTEDNHFGSCTSQGVLNELPFSQDRNFTPANYSPN